MAASAAAAARGHSRPSSSDEESLSKGEGERDFSHNYFLVDRKDFNAAAAFEDFDPSMFMKGLYASEVVGHFSTAIKHFLVSLGNVFALRPEAHAVLQLKDTDFLQGLASLGYMSSEADMTSRCEGAGPLHTEHFIRAIVLNHVKEMGRGLASAIASHQSSGQKMNFGQYANLTFRQVYEGFPAYTAWGFTQTAPGKGLKAYLDFACEMDTLPGLHNEEFNVNMGTRIYFRALTGPEFMHVKETGMIPVRSLFNTTNLHVDLLGSLWMTWHQLQKAEVQEAAITIIEVKIDFKYFEADFLRQNVSLFSRLNWDTSVAFLEDPCQGGAPCFFMACAHQGSVGGPLHEDLWLPDGIQSG